MRNSIVALGVGVLLGAGLCASGCASDDKKDGGTAGDSGNADARKDAALPDVPKGTGSGGGATPTGVEAGAVKQDAKPPSSLPDGGSERLDGSGVNGVMDVSHQPLDVSIAAPPDTPGEAPTGGVISDTGSSDTGIVQDVLGAAVDPPIDVACALGTCPMCSPDLTDCAGTVPKTCDASVRNSRRIIDGDFSAGARGCYNAVTVAPGYGGSPYAVASAGGMGPNGPLPFGIRAPVEAGKSYWVTAVVKGEGYGYYLHSPFLQTANSFNYADWTCYRGVVRVHASGQELGALFVDISGAQLGYAVVDEWTNAQRAAYNDWAMERFTVDVGPAVGTLAQRLALAPNTLDKIVNGGTLKVAGVGDSLMSDTCQSSWPELLQRTFPGLTVQLMPFTLGSTGTTGWLAADKSGIYAWQPDLIYFGGISTDWTKTQDAYDLIDAFRANIPGVEIMLGSPVRWDPTDAAGPRVAAICEAKGCVYYPASAMYNPWLVASGIEESTIMRDSVHFNAVGWEVAGRCLARFFGATFPTDSQAEP